MSTNDEIENAKPNQRDYVTSLDRGLKIISAFDTNSPQMTLSQVAEKTGLSRAVSRRFLLTLSQLGYVSADGRLFRLTPKVLGLGFAYLSATPIAEIAQPYLEEVTKKTGESSSLAVLNDKDVVYIARSASQRILMIGVHVGTRLPAVYTSMGRVLLADLSDEEIKKFLKNQTLTRRTQYTITSKASLIREIQNIRQQGYAIIDQELEEGVCSIAVPIHATSTGRVIAAINVAILPSRTSRQRLVKNMLPILKEAASSIEQAKPT